MGKRRLHGQGISSGTKFECYFYVGTDERVIAIAGGAPTARRVSHFDGAVSEKKWRGWREPRDRDRRGVTLWHLAPGDYAAVRLNVPRGVNFS